MSLERASTKAFPEEDPEFQVAPMIDVLLVLLVFFMSITSTEILKTKSKLDIVLPVAVNGKKSEGKPSEVVLNLGWSATEKIGQIEFEGNELSGPESVTDVILKRKEGKPNFRCVIRATEQVPYHYVQSIMQAAAAAQVDNITFSVVSKKNEKKPDSTATGQ